MSANGSDCLIRVPVLCNSLCRMLHNYFHNYFQYEETDKTSMNMLM